jgi:glyoxylase-like metal-dependent hydrolase (beta-lactamase superfamily II)
VKEVFPDLFQLRIPLPIPALKHLNAYLIRTEGQYVLIDTGIGSDRAFRELSRQLAEIGVKPESLTDILVTHFHIDHVGLVPRLRKLSGARLVVSAKTTEAVRLVRQTHESYWENLMNTYKVAGVPTELLEQMLKATPGYLYQAVYEELARPSRALEDGEKTSIGEYSFQAIWTPGHSPGHICLYEPKRRLLIAGDHLLPTITPHVTQWSGESDALTDYLDSLEKIGKLDVDLVLPAHEDLFQDHRKRISELQEHHRLRATEMLSEIQKQELTAFQIASRIHWDIEYASWDRFPLFQKFLAVGETLAHLEFLKKQGQVRKNIHAETAFYRAI